MNTLGRIFFGTIVGLLLAMLLFMLDGTDPDEFMQGLLILVVCTAGLGSIPILVGGYIVGSILDLLYRHTFMTEEKRTQLYAKEYEQKHPVSNYVKQARATGISDIVIAQRLAAAGWDEKVVTKALEL